MELIYITFIFPLKYKSCYRWRKSKKILISLLDDDDVDGHAIAALSKFKDIELIKYIEPFLNHKMTWKRNEAKKAIKKLEKLRKIENE